ncbi:MAG: hypothetical protein ACRCX8_03495, partial [Sarcina sp.]
MEFVLEVLRGVFVFNLIESIIFCKYFERVGRNKKVEWFNIVFISFVNYFISILFTPMLYQIVSILFMGIYLGKLRNIDLKESIMIITNSALFI